MIQYCVVFEGHMGEMFPSIQSYIYDAAYGHFLYPECDFSYACTNYENTLKSNPTAKYGLYKIVEEILYDDAD